MAQDSGEYRKLLTEFIQKQMVVFGPNIALEKARGVPGLSLNDDGSVLDISGDAELVLRSVASAYATLSGQISQTILNELFTKYPSLKKT
jgi:hypothetical protein